MSEYFSADEKLQLSKFVSNIDRAVFALSGLPEEVIAVLFAYYSRSPESLRRNLLKLLAEEGLETSADAGSVSSNQLLAAQEKARAFHEKWVVGYGHASVAEHAVVHLGIENISILASKVLEDARLASFTEKSTRYVVFDQSRYLKPRAIMQSRHAARYVETADQLFGQYLTLMSPVQDELKRRIPVPPGTRPAAHMAACRAKACDILRYFLPAATLTNIGMTLNGRSVEHLISRLLSHPFDELRQFGADIQRESATILPTLVKYAAYNPYRALTYDGLSNLAESDYKTTDARIGPSVRLLRYDSDAETVLVTALLYPHTRLPWQQLRDQVLTHSPEKRAHVIDEAMKRRGKFDNSIRELEHLTYTFDLLIDFGAYRDIQRHRMATQTAQALSIDHGYDVPEELETFGMMDVFEECMEKAAHCYSAMVGSLPFEASYIVPLAFRRRVLITWNLREVIHFIELRSAPQGHRSYRRVAQEMFRQIEQVHPFIAHYIRVIMETTDLERLACEEKIAEKLEQRSQIESNTGVDAKVR